MKDLRLLVCSDPHGSEEAATMLSEVVDSETFDGVVVCGDFTTFGTTEYTKKFLARFKTRVFAVPGNCDVPETVAALEDANASVHNLMVNLDGVKIFGFGGGLPTNSGMPFEIDEAIIERSLRSVATPGGVMVTHTPSYGFNDLTRDGRRLGSEGILRVAQEFKPVLACAGHVHEARGRILSTDTVFLNPGPAKNGFYATALLGEVVEVELKQVQLPRHR